MIGEILLVLILLMGVIRIWIFGGLEVIEY